MTDFTGNEKWHNWKSQTLQQAVQSEHVCFSLMNVRIRLGLFHEQLTKFLALKTWAFLKGLAIFFQKLAVYVNKQHNTYTRV